MTYTEEDEQDFILSARYGELEEVQEYLKNGIRLNAVDYNKNTALHMACANGHLEIVKELLKHSPEFLKNSSGNTPLHWAVQNSHSEIVPLLLAYSKDIDVLSRNKFGRGALSESFDAGNQDVTVMLLEHSSAKQLDPPGAEDEEEEEGEGEEEGEEEAEEETKEEVPSHTEEANSESQEKK